MMKCFYPVFAFCLLSGSVNAQVITVSSMTTGLTRPVCITNSGVAGDNRLFVIEKAGRIRIVDRVSGTLNPVNFLNIASKINSSGNEQGLLGLAFHPDYATNGFFFVNYTNLGGHTVVARYKVSAFADTALTNSEQILMTVYQPFSNHNGGNLMFGKDHYLYINMGDGGDGGDPGNRAQNIDSLLGKILRIDVNNPNPPYYFSPPSNMFYGAKPGRDEIFDMGFRNPWKASIDRMTGDKWFGDVGQNAYEEIDYESFSDSLGKNYGWKCYEGTHSYVTTGCQPYSFYAAPVAEYSHSLGCSVTGGYVYRGGQEGGLFGKYLFADYCSGRIWATYPNGSGGWTTTLLTQTNALNTNSYSSFGEDSYGEIYLAKDGASGAILRLKDTACAPTAYISASDTVINCSNTPITLNAIYGTNLLYQWKRNGINISGATASTYSAALAGNYSCVVTNSSNCSATSNTIAIVANGCLNLKFFIEGYYTSGGMMRQVLYNEQVDPNSASTKADTILVELHHAVNTAIVVGSYKGVINTNGTLACTFAPATVSNSYYVAIRHRNAIQTWSASPVTINSITATDYDFTTATTKAWSNNMIQAEPGVWAFYSGDINQDENIDLLDFPQLDNHIVNGLTGYRATDLNGDGNVDLVDFPILDANIILGIYSRHP